MQGKENRGKSTRVKGVDFMRVRSYRLRDFSFYINPTGGMKPGYTVLERGCFWFSEPPGSICLACIADLATHLPHHCLLI